MNHWTPTARLSESLVDERGKALELPALDRESYSADEWALQASYDLYKRYNNGSTDHWQYATNQSADALETYELRNAVINLVRYEYRNNPTFKSIIERIVFNVLRTGPTLDIVPKNKSEASNKAAKQLEANWSEHAEAIGLLGKLQLIMRERPVAGESFSVFRRNPKVPAVGIDFEVYEPEQFTDSLGEMLGREYHKMFSTEYPPNDGVVYDRWGNPETYHRLKYHPGGRSYGSGLQVIGVEKISAEKVVHFYTKTRPSQSRGVSHGADCVELLGKMRRVDEAIVNTLEKEAKMLASMETNLPIGACTTIGGKRLAWEWQGTQVTSTPHGWKMNPWNTGTGKVQNYREVKSELKREVTARFLLPWNVATSSEEFNFASARIDTILWNHYIDIIRQEIECEILNRYFKWWLEFAVFAGIVPRGLGAFSFRWFWPSKEPLDEAKKAKTDETYHKMGQFDELEFWKEKGKDAFQVFDEKVSLAERKKKRLEKSGLTIEEVNGSIETPATNEAADSETGDVDKNAITKTMLDAYGVGVRAGTLTPQQGDEEFFRGAMGIPEKSKSVDAAWNEEPTRRPLTLVKPGDPEGDELKVNDEEVVDET